MPLDSISKETSSAVSPRSSSGSGPTESDPYVAQGGLRPPDRCSYEGEDCALGSRGGKKLEQLDKGLTRLKKMKNRKADYLSRAADLELRIGRVVVRQHRTAHRWLRRWERL